MKRKKETPAPSLLEKKTRIERINEALEFPPTLLSNNPIIELMGNREAIVDGVRGVVEYDERLIRLNTGRGIIRFTGSELLIASLNDHQAIIRGFIAAVEFLL